MPVAQERSAAPVFDFSMGEEVEFTVKGRVVARTESEERGHSYLLEGVLPWGYVFKRFVNRDDISKAGGGTN